MRIWAVTVGLALVWGGCGSSDSAPSEGDKACQDFEAKLAQCNIQAQGVCNSSQPCTVKCAAEADCNQILESPPTGSHLACLGECTGVGADAFACKDGKKIVARAGVCNGDFNCLDGSDEENCGVKDAGGPG